MAGSRKRKLEQRFDKRMVSLYFNYFYREYFDMEFMEYTHSLN